MMSEAEAEKAVADAAAKLDGRPNRTAAEWEAAGNELEAALENLEAIRDAKLEAVRAAEFKQEQAKLWGYKI
jgi:hypothetical protein